jgi:hypothetical protein
MTTELKPWDELSPAEQAAATFWDFYKEVHGFRPRHIDTSSWNLSDFDREFKLLEVQAEANRKYEAESEAICADKFERRMLTLLECGAKDREMALRWVHEAEGSYGDNSYLCFLLGLPYNYFM